MLRRSHARVIEAAAVAACIVIAGVSAPAAAGDVGLGTVDGISYVSDQTPAVPTGSGSPLVLARCAADRELVGGGVAMNYNDTAGHLHWIYPTTTEGDEGSFALSFWNNSGGPLVGTATAACARKPHTAKERSIWRSPTRTSPSSRAGRAGRP